MTIQQLWQALLSRRLLLQSNVNTALATAVIPKPIVPAVRDLGETVANLFSQRFVTTSQLPNIFKKVETSLSELVNLPRMISFDNPGRDFVTLTPARPVTSKWKEATIGPGWQRKGFDLSVNNQESDDQKLQTVATQLSDEILNKPDNQVAISQFLSSAKQLLLHREKLYDAIDRGQIQPLDLCSLPETLGSETLDEFLPMHKRKFVDSILHSVDRRYSFADLLSQISIESRSSAGNFSLDVDKLADLIESNTNVTEKEFRSHLREQIQEKILGSLKTLLVRARKAFQAKLLAQSQQPSSNEKTSNTSLTRSSYVPEEVLAREYWRSENWSPRDPHGELDEYRNESPKELAMAKFIPFTSDYFNY